jgi:aminoglycoside phosphotransferase
LKIAPLLEPEYERLKWLDGRLPAPRPIAFVKSESAEAILMSSIAGQDLADLSSSLPPETIIKRLANVLQTLHAACTTGWPFGGNGTLVHGDACLPNFLYSGDCLTGYIDVGDLALADPEVDLAAAVWSLQYNLGSGWGLPFLREYGVADADEEVVERLRLSY